MFISLFIPVMNSINGDFNKFSLKKIIYLFMRETDREREAETQPGGEAGSMQKPDVGLKFGTPGLLPGPKAGAQLPSHPGIPINFL